jgi:hypothetical protein
MHLSGLCNCGRLCHTCDIDHRELCIYNAHRPNSHNVCLERRLKGFSRLWGLHMYANINRNSNHCTQLLGFYGRSLESLSVPSILFHLMNVSVKVQECNTKSSYAVKIELQYSIDREANDLGSRKFMPSDPRTA